MATNYNPAIVTDGLVLCVDAANSKSYPGSGSTFFDLSGNNRHGTLLNSPAHDTEAGGCFHFDATNERISLPINLQDTQSTVMGIARYATSSGNGRVISATNNWLMGWYAGNTSYYYANSGWVHTGNGGNTTDWICFTATGDTVTGNYKFYRNAVLIKNLTNSNLNGPDIITLGGWSYGAHEASNCKVAYLSAYQRVLSPTEIEQNYQAVRSRFGL